MTDTDRRNRRQSQARASRLPTFPLSSADAPWLASALLAGVAIAVLYIGLNGYPAFGAGLYTLAAETVRTNGYALPTAVPHYSTRGVPFAYPPFVFYALAVLRDLGADTFTTALVVPPLVTLAHVVPMYLLGRDLLGRRAAGTAAALLFVCNPQVLQWHVSAGGLVRATALLFALSSIYAALRIFRGGETRWVPVGLATFSLVVLTHPTYTLFTVVSYLVLWVGDDRSLAGLVRGAAVGVGGLLVTAPWWLAVGRTHGFDIFTAAAGTHGGLGGGLANLLAHGPDWTLVPIGAALVLVLARRYTLAIWPVVTWVLFMQPRFTYVVGSLTVVGAAIEIAGRSDHWAGLAPRRRRSVLVALLVVGASLGVGVVGYQFAGAYDETTPEFVDEESVEAMEWAAAETRPDATFVVLGDAAEWFPVVADRTIEISPWGLEWREPETYYGHLGTFKEASTCGTVTCVNSELRALGATPDYVYVPKGAYTVRGDRVRNFGTLDRSFERSDRYERVFENEGVVVYRVREEFHTPAP